MGYRITTHKARTTKDGTAFSARHLDRHFDLKKAKHIDPSRCHLNRYVDFDVDDNGNLHHSKSKNIQEHELSVYGKLFQKRLDTVNARYLAQRHPEKCKTLKQYYKSPQSCPDEYLIYIGDKNNHANSDVLKGAASKLISKLQKKYHKNFIPLSIAVHRDELGIGEDGEGSHIHFRCVWISTDKNGTKASISQGMKDAGITLPDTEKVEQKYNNRQMAFSEEIRSTFADICEQEFGLEIERDARDSSRAGRDLATYQREQAMNDVQRLTSQNDTLMAERLQLEEEVQELRTEKTRLQRLASALKIALDRIYGKISRLFSHTEQELFDNIYKDAVNTQEDFFQLSM